MEEEAINGTIPWSNLSDQDLEDLDRYDDEDNVSPTDFNQWLESLS